MRTEGGRLWGQVTIFVSLVMVCVFSLFCVLLESARTAGARWYLQVGVSSALDSVFAGYHRMLWDEYRLLLVPYGREEELEADFSQYLRPYLETGNWYPMQLESAEAKTVIRAPDESGRYFEQEILDYMKYGVWKLDFDEEEAGALQGDMQEALSVTEIAGLYRGRSQEALELEKSLEAISRSLVRQRQKKEEGMGRLESYDCDGFCQAGEKLIGELEQVPALVADYRQKADALASGLLLDRSRAEEKREECSQSVWELLQQEITSYESYVSEDGERRQEVEALDPRSQEQIAFVRAVMEQAREVEQIIEDWEDEEEEGSDGPDLEALWRPVRRQFAALSIDLLSFHHGVPDKETEGFLKRVEALYGEGLLALAMPEGRRVSERAVSLEERVSSGDRDGRLRTMGLFVRLMVNEYCGLFFRNFRGGGRGGYERIWTESEEKTSDFAEAVLEYEMEYVMAGKESDRENLADVVSSLLKVREGLNFIHILTDAKKREQARTLAMAITGLAGVTPLLLVTLFFVMSVWALGEALMDVRGLLAGKRVPLFKTAADWSLETEALVGMGKTGEIGEGGGERGLSYLSWLKILLLMGNGIVQEYRMMDLIQWNIRQEQELFNIEDGVYQAVISGTVREKHLFFSLGFAEQFIGEGKHGYLSQYEAERSY